MDRFQLNGSTPPLLCSNVETAFDGKNLYVAWQDSDSGNQEIFLRKSVDGGITFGQIINVSDNEGTSECPSKLHSLPINQNTE